MVVELLFDLLQNVAGVRLDVALKMRADAREKEQVAIGNGAGEQRLGWLRAHIMDLLDGASLCPRGAGRSHGGDGSFQEFTSIVGLHDFVSLFTLLSGRGSVGRG